jgi:hypothetical protein
MCPTPVSDTKDDNSDRLHAMICFAPHLVSLRFVLIAMG